jgi:hypothetical protein
MYADGIEDSNVRSAVHRIAGEIHERLLLLENVTGANPQTQVDSPNNPPPSQNPAPQNPAGLKVAFNVATGFYNVTVTAPWNVAAESANQLSARTLAAVPLGVTATYNLQSSTDANFQANVTDYGIGSQHVFTVPGPAGLFFRVFTSVDGGQTFGDASPAKDLLATLAEA